MYPFNSHKPQYKESIVVGIVDKAVAVYEFFGYKVKAYAYFALLFVTSGLR